MLSTVSEYKPNGSVSNAEEEAIGYNKLYFLFWSLKSRKWTHNLYVTIDVQICLRVPT